MGEWNALTSEMPQAGLGVPVAIIVFAIALVILVAGLLLWTTQKW
jgi:hypothetical protein